jgi:uncharacterized RDD family membrane protein YckC
MSNADQYTLETPENIEVDFEVAGLGSRFCAMLIDSLVLGLIVLALIVLAAILGFATLPAGLEGQFRPGRVAGWLLALVLAVVMALISGGYFLLFELLMRGQTPGKKAMKLRVIRDDGTPVTANEVLLRNILRLVDFLPFGYAVGALVMFPNPLCKRLGDLAAGTIVVKEGQLDYRAQADKKHLLGPVTVTAANAELTAEERRVLTGFLQRRAELLPEARRALAERLAGPLHVKYAGHYDDAEGYLERLAEGRHYES